ncbi:aspartyl-tRNA(Asn)/glutamyl-tRNA(Gln) amidotransferase subunit A [Pararhizobium capsulatum DSM 1112]|uniref:Aspartyl-tRNA(Asn)/glutamyl-tRNA(Gln) amidotransferase subunit A n=1 Tax=Pararhizobium capsulatum DSM 1112 TaxID=1121113 RepID=A0ABU0BMR8_9HYPH|nr:amidase [Pararhizobium capsulatum]MDQ0318172.1 aspartyl-tRNA(Asn)/glutamyl-tRNA(Gln) amidotransferase subunit A [Pararhizobium capsulatum DSM 1112]
MIKQQGPIRNRLEDILTRLDARRDQERTYVTLYPHSARAEAGAADARFAAGKSLGPMDGKIISIKDLFDIAGEPTLAGSVIRRQEAAATEDAVIVRRLRDAGAIILGKTHMTEFAFTAVGLNLHYPVPGNAFDAALIPGGSSSGAAVSAAEGTCDIAIGSDTGGSVRIPAALNGIVGFKPTARRVPLVGAFPLAPSLDSIGPLAGTVADCALADAIMAGEVPSPLQTVPLSELKVGIPRGRLFQDTQTDILAAFDQVVGRLRKADCEIVDVMIDDLLEEFRQATQIGSIAGIEASRVHAGWLNDENPLVDERVTSTLRRRAQVNTADLEAILDTRVVLAQRMDERIAGFDSILLPATPISAVPIATVETDEFEYRRVEDLLLRNTQVANQFDLSAITLPLRTTSLPAGIMLMGANGGDRRLLDTAAAVEVLLATLGLPNDTDESAGLEPQLL